MPPPAPWRRRGLLFQGEGAPLIRLGRRGAERPLSDPVHRPALPQRRQSPSGTQPPACSPKHKTTQNRHVVPRGRRPSDPIVSARSRSAASRSRRRAGLTLRFHIPHLIARSVSALPRRPLPQAALHWHAGARCNASGAVIHSCPNSLPPDAGHRRGAMLHDAPPDGALASPKGAHSSVGRAADS